MSEHDYTPAMQELHTEIIRCVRKFATPPHSIHPGLEVAVVAAAVGMLAAGLVKLGVDEDTAHDVIAENAAAGYDYAMHKTASNAA